MHRLFLILLTLLTITVSAKSASLKPVLAYVNRAHIEPNIKAVKFVDPDGKPVLNWHLVITNGRLTSKINCDKNGSVSVDLGIYGSSVKVAIVLEKQFEYSKNYVIPSILLDGNLTLGVFTSKPSYIFYIM